MEQPPEEQRIVPKPGEHLLELGRVPAAGSAAGPQLDLGQETAMKWGLEQKVVQQEGTVLGLQKAFELGWHQGLALGVEDSLEGLLNLAAAEADSPSAAADPQQHSVVSQTSLQRPGLILKQMYQCQLIVLQRMRA